MPCQGDVDTAVGQAVKNIEIDFVGGVGNDFDIDIGRFFSKTGNRRRQIDIRYFQNIVGNSDTQFAGQMRLNGVDAVAKLIQMPE